MTSKPQFGVAVEYVKDLAAAKRFYVEVLGLEIEREMPTYVQFEKFALATDQPMGDGAPEFYWLVPDAEAAYKDLSQKAEVSLPLKQEPFGKVFAIKDPDGHPRYVLEPAPGAM